MKLTDPSHSLPPLLQPNSPTPHPLVPLPLKTFISTFVLEIPTQH